MSEITSSKKNQMVWLDLVKAFALSWIFVNHVAERLFGSPYIANPFYGWPALSERIAQLAPLMGFGIWDIPINSLRYFGWFGDQGVQLFLIASGFGLTWGLLQRQQQSLSPVWKFYLKRAKRIFPLWWGAHLLFAATWLVTGWGLSLFDPSFYLSLLGIPRYPSFILLFPACLVVHWITNPALPGLSVIMAWSSPPRTNTPAFGKLCGRISYFAALVSIFLKDT